MRGAIQFIEPVYYPPEANDEHLPHDILSADQLVSDAYNVLTANEGLWQSTLLVLVFDGHSGFYDHVVPPKAIPPDFHSEEFDFKQFGVRVPALLVSHYAPKQIGNTEFDHTSILKHLVDKMGPRATRKPCGRRKKHRHSPIKGADAARSSTLFGVDLCY